MADKQSGTAAPHNGHSRPKGQGRNDAGNDERSSTNNRSPQKKAAHRSASSSETATQKRAPNSRS